MRTVRSCRRARSARGSHRCNNERRKAPSARGAPAPGCELCPYDSGRYNRPECRPGIENHGFQGNDPEFLTGLLLDVDSPRLGLTLDSATSTGEGWPLSRVYEIFEQFAPVVKHTHIKNIAYPPEIRETQREIGYEYGKYVSPIHQGDIDHTRYFAALRSGYDRDLCLEDESLGKYTPGGA